MAFTELKNVRGEDIGQQEGFALVKACDKKIDKNRNPYLDMVLFDGETEFASKFWDYDPTAGYEPKVNTIVKVRGVKGEYKNKPQFKVTRIRDITELDPVSKEDFIVHSRNTGEEMFSAITAVVDGFSDPDLKRLTAAALTEFRDRIIELPAANKLHHAQLGGLLTHTLTMLRVAQALCGIYVSLDADLLFTGVILHDLEKSSEFVINDLGLVDSYSEKGKLLGHLFMGARTVERIGKELGIDEEKLTLVEHMIISHHGIPEFGAVVRPLFLEAEVLSEIDLLDAKIFEIESATAELRPGEFSAKQWALDDRCFYRHGRKEVTTDVDIL
ncbi:MAG: HD domain-containing protein [Clostridia bacterium]|nr:HD domain-containing protein [Clostridia bacterium]